MWEDTNSIIASETYVNLIFGGVQASLGQIPNNKNNRLDGGFSTASNRMAECHRGLVEGVDMVKEAFKAVEIFEKDKYQSFASLDPMYPGRPRIKALIS